MKVFMSLFILAFCFELFSQSVITADVSHRDCFGGLGLCGNIDMTSLSLKEDEDTFSEFYLILNEDKSAQIDLTNIGTTEIFFELTEDVIMDVETLSIHHLNSNKIKIKSGLYPVFILGNQIKIKFNLSENQE